MIESPYDPYLGLPPACCDWCDGSGVRDGEECRFCGGTGNFTEPEPEDDA